MAALLTLFQADTDKCSDRYAGEPLRGASQVMSDQAKADEPERLEEYLELERYLEQLQDEQRPRRPRRIAPCQVSIYQLAALFHAAAPGAAEPDARFVRALWIQVEGLLCRRRIRCLAPVILYHRR